VVAKVFIEISYGKKRKEIFPKRVATLKQVKIARHQTQRLFPPRQRHGLFMKNFPKKYQLIG
jgi:hypothetical protein